MSKYAALDGAILASLVRSEPLAFAGIFVGVVKDECSKIAFAEGEQKEPSRILDRRLQALRKAEKVRFVSKGWLLRDAGHAS